MQDKYRFRAWDKQEKKYIYGVEKGLNVVSQPTGNIDYWKANERIFCELPVSEQQTAISQILYRHNQKRKALIKDTPNCLHASLYFAKYNGAQIEQIQRLLKQKEGD